MDAYDKDYVGEVLENVFRFHNSGWDTDLEFSDTITQEKVSGSTMFTNINGRWHLRAASLPGDLSICAIAIDEDFLFVEAAPFDSGLFLSMVKELGVPFFFDLQHRRIADQSQKTVLLISSPCTFEVGQEKLAPRCLCKAPLRGMTPLKQKQLIMLVDKMFTNKVFVNQVGEESTARTVEPGLRLELNMGLIQSLELFQRPIMALKQEGRQEGQMEATQSQQQVQLQALFVVQRRIQQMSREELLEYTAQQVAEKGELAVLRVFSFVLAGRIKKVRPGLTWRKARLVADKLLVPSR